MDTIIDSAAWLAELEAIRSDILDCEPVKALERIDCLLDELEGLKRAPPSIACGALGCDGN